MQEFTRDFSQDVPPMPAWFVAPDKPKKWQGPLSDSDIRQAHAEYFYGNETQEKVAKRWGVTGATLSARFKKLGLPTHSPFNNITSPSVPMKNYSALAGLMGHLPGNGRWTQTERDSFLTAYTAVLDMLIEVADE